jgi:hypothetical protein
MSNQVIIVSNLFNLIASLISLLIRLPILIGSLYKRSEYGDPLIKRLVPATILAENSNIKNLPFLSYTPYKQKGPGIPGATNSFVFSAKFSAIENTSCNSDSRRTSGKLPITL